MDINDLKLWNLSEMLTKVIEDGFVMDEETGEIYFTTDELEALEMGLDDKIHGLMNTIRRYEANKENAKKRKNEIALIEKNYDKKVTYLKNFLKFIMEKHDINKREFEDGILSTRKSKSLNIENEEKVRDYINNHPELKEKCLKEELVSSVIKSGIKEIIEEGTEIPGAFIVENKNIVIK